MQDASPSPNTLHRQTSLLSKNWRISRRLFLGVTLTGLLAACGSSPTTTTSPTATATLPPRMLAPTGSISPANAASLQKLGVLNVKMGRVRGVAWSPDSKTLAIGTERAVQLWDVSTGKLQATLQGATEQVYQLAWSPDGQLLAAGVADNTTRVWNMQSHDLLQTLPGTDSVVFGVAWSPSGDRLAAGNSDGAVQIWERANWNKAGSWNDPSTPGQFHSGRFHTAAYTVGWSPDGQLLAATRYDGYLRVWNASSGKLLHLLPTSSQPNGLSWSPDGHILALSSDDGTVQFWDTASYQNTRTLNAKEQGEWAFAIPWSPDGRLLACSRDGGSMQVWDTQAGKELKSLSEQANSIWTAAWSPDNLRIASGSDDGTVVLWGVH